MYLIIPFLSWNAILDLRQRKVSIGSLLLFSLIGFILLFTSEGQKLLYHGEPSVWRIIAGVGFGILLLVLSWISSGAVGAGDAMVAVVLGLYLGIDRVLLLFMAGFLLSGMTGFALIMMGKADRKSHMPLMPFLLAGYLILLLTGWM